MLCTTYFGFTCIVRILARVYSVVPFTDTWYVVGHRREDHQNNPAHLVHGEGVVTRNESNDLGTYLHLNRTLLIPPSCRVLMQKLISI